MKAMEQALAIMNERFGKESELSLATLDGEQPAVRIVNSVYQDGSFYVITDQRSRKMKQIAAHPQVAVLSLIHISECQGF